MKRAALLFSALLCFALLCLVAPPAGHGPYAAMDAASGEIWSGDGSDAGAAPAEATVVARDLWFVELKSKPLLDSGTDDEAAYLAQLKKEKVRFRLAAGAAGIAYQERYAYDLLFNGLSVKVDARNLLALSRLPGVTALYPVGIESLPGPAIPLSPGDVSPDLFTAITMTGADLVQASGITGAGIRVSVIDTGIDYTHPDLGGGFGPGYRVEAGYDFVGDAYTGPDGTEPPKPDPDPLDCAGHGTHVSGIVGANGRVKGVAPGVIFHAYRVFGCSGNTGDDVILKAMERVVNDGSQVLNMSLGSPFGWPQWPIARAANVLVNHGVVVVASAGNSGGAGLYSAGAPGVGEKVIGVGSVDNKKVHSPAFQLANGTLIGYQQMAGAQAPPTSGTYDIASVGRACNSSPPNPALVAGRVALIQRGTCTFREKATNARAAGAVAALIYNNSPGLFLGTVGSPALAFPVASVSQEDGNYIISQLPTTLTWTDQFTDVPNVTGGRLSSFTAYGVSPDLTLKPDLTAPGGLIFSTWPLAQGGYALLSGTSMSSPHVAGAVALLLEAHPRTSPQVVRDILQNSAVPPLWWAHPGFGLPDNTHQQGAGLLDIKAAVDATTRVFPGKLSLGETEGQAITRSLQLENDGAADITYTLSHQPALATGPNTFLVAKFVPDDATASFSTPSLFVPAGGTASVDVTITAPDVLPDRSLFGGYIVLTPDDGGRVLRVPYAGFKGDYQSILVLNPAASKFGNPLLRATPDVGASGPITIDPAAKENNLAYVAVHLDHQVRRLRLEIFSSTGRAFGRVGEFWYVERNSTPSEFFILAWDGTDRFGAPVPNGAYVIKVSIEKALGQDDNPADWETWTSPVVTVDRSASPRVATVTLQRSRGSRAGASRIAN